MGEELDGNRETHGKCKWRKKSCWNVRCTGKVGAHALTKGIVWAPEKKIGKTAGVAWTSLEPVPNRNK